MIWISILNLIITILLIIFIYPSKEFEYKKYHTRIVFIEFNFDYNDHFIELKKDDRKITARR